MSLMNRSLNTLFILGTLCILASSVSGSLLRNADNGGFLHKKNDDSQSQQQQQQQQQQKELIESMLDGMLQLTDQNKVLMEQNQEQIKLVKEVTEVNKELMDTQHRQQKELIEGMLDEMQQLAGQNKKLMEDNRDRRRLQAQRSGGDIFARRVFLTSSTYRIAQFNGLSGADHICQTHANNANLGGIYKAWLSDSTASPSTRFFQSQGPYVLVNGTVIADNWADLIDGNIKAPINLHENGQPFAAGSTATPWVFTGTTTGGTDYSPFTCSDWTDTSRTLGLRLGKIEKKDYAWTDAGQQFCNTNLRLYCFEQYPTA